MNFIARKPVHLTGKYAISLLHDPSPLSLQSWCSILTFGEDEVFFCYRSTREGALREAKIYARDDAPHRTGKPVGYIAVSEVS